MGSPEPSSSSDDEYLYTLGQNGEAIKTPTVSVQVNGTEIEVIVDTGASTDIVDEATFSTFNHIQDIQLQTPTKRLFAYGSDSQLKVLGKFDATITFKNRSQISTIHVL